MDPALQNPVFEKMTATGLVPVFYHSDAHICKKVIEACYKGGLRVFEFTNRGNNAQSVFKTLRPFVQENYPDLAFGIGSVIDAPTAASFIQAGADFVVSPILHEPMAGVCQQRNIGWIPGCGTATEVMNAQAIGAEIVKLFPASQLGPGFISALKGPCPWCRIMPTGGVTAQEEDLKAWFEAGAACVGMGSKLVEKDAVRNGDYDRVTQKCREALAIVKRIRQQG